MSIIAIAIRHLITAGVAGDALILIIAELEDELARLKTSYEQPKYTTRQLRNQRYYDGSRLKMSENRLNASNSSETSYSDASPLDGFNGFPHPSLTSLNPPKENTPKGVQKKNPNFEIFWEAFPRQRRGNKQKAEAAYRQALSRCSPAEILSGLKAYADSAEVAGGFAKGAAAWLNDDRWSNDYSVITHLNVPKSFDQQAKDKTEQAMQEVLRRANPS